MDIFFQLQMLLAAFSGLIAHWCLFIRGEWHMHAPHIFVVHVLLACLLLWAEVRGKYFESLAGASLATFELGSIYLTALCCSIAVYRVLFHRLRRFPGPFGAKVSNLWHAYKCLGARNHLLLDELHYRYGDFVRTGEPCGTPQAA